MPLNNETLGPYANSVDQDQTVPMSSLIFVLNVCYPGAISTILHRISMSKL